MGIDFAKMGFDSIDEYQRFHGLPASGVIDRLTERSINAPRYCGLPDRMNLGGRICMWGKRKLTCSWMGDLPEIGDGDMVTAIRAAWQAWETVCGISVETMADNRDADVLVFSKTLDGKAGVLAQAELPCGQDRQRPVEVDLAEPWVTILDPPRYRVSIVLTLIHEFGHTLGLVHGPPGSIMQATYSSSIKKPQAWDIAEAQQRYGAPVEPPTIPAEPGEPSEFVTLPSFKIPKSWIIQ